MGASQFNVYRYVADSNVLFAVTTAVSSFMFFKGLKMRHHKWINAIASTTFGVLLIHANSDIMRQWLWRDLLHNADRYYSNGALIYAVIAILLVFAICSLIDYLRIHAIEVHVLKIIGKYLSKYNLQ